jgi:exopolyphosphatase / guanosine-5'-triphosphate,3'-diphosphate pyrophosphatase
MQPTPDSQFIAAVDIGSNTVHVVIAAVDSADRHLAIVDRRVEILRLGADIASIGAIGPERAARTEQALREMAALAERHRVIARLGVATEGVRAASNATEMLARFSAAWGAPITLIDGMEEAALTFWGATSAIADPSARLAVGDLGGGSCEIVVGEAGQITWARSLPLGSGRLIDAVAPADPPASADFAALAEHAGTVLAALPPPDPPVNRLVAVGGTANSIPHILRSRSSTPQGKRTTLTHADLDEAVATLGSAPASAIAAEFGIEAERAKVLVGGTVAWRAIAQWLHVDVMEVSQRGVREGAIIAWLRAGDQWQRYAHEAVGGAGE